MTELELVEIARTAFSNKSVEKVLHAYRPTGRGIEIDVVDLAREEPLLDIQFTNTCIIKRLVAQPIQGEKADPVKAFCTCLEADVIDALILSREPLPELDRMAALTHTVLLADGQAALGWLYHLEADNTLTVYECAEKPAQLTGVRRGQFSGT